MESKMKKSKLITATHPWKTFFVLFCGMFSFFYFYVICLVIIDSLKGGISKDNEPLGGKKKRKK